jgi:hypothetical protein
MTPFATSEGDMHEGSISANGRAVYTSLLWRQDAVVFPAFLLLVGILTYFPSFLAGFLSDDWVFIWKLSHASLADIWNGSVSTGVYRPLVFMLLKAEHRLWGTTPLPFHVASVILHIINAHLAGWLSFKVLSRADTTNRQAAMLTAFLFLILPSHAEAVAWISGRFDIVCTFLVLVSTLTYCRHLETGRNRYLVCALFLFVAGLLSKEAALAAPFIWAAIEVYQRRKFRWLPYLLTAGLAIIYSLFRVHTWSQLLPEISQQFSIRAIIGRPPQLFIRSFVPSLAHPPAFATVMTAILLLALLATWQIYQRTQVRRELTTVCFLGILLVLALLPVWNLSIDIGDTCGERYVYMASIFSCMILAFLATIIPGRLTYMLVGLLSAGCITALVQSNLDWKVAGQLTEFVLTDIKMLKHDASVLNLPDRYLGSYVFRNGFQEALKLQGVTVGVSGPFATQKLLTRDEPVAFARVTDGCLLRATHRNVWQQAQSSGCVSIEEVNVIRFGDCFPRYTYVYFFSAGKLRSAACD